MYASLKKKKKNLVLYATNKSINTDLAAQLLITVFVTILGEFISQESDNPTWMRLKISYKMLFLIKMWSFLIR